MVGEGVGGVGGVLHERGGELGISRGNCSILSGVYDPDTRRFI